MESQDFLKRLYTFNQQMSRNYPTKLMAQKFLTDLSNLLFPVCKEVTINPGKIEVAWEHLKLSLKELLLPVQPVLKKEAEEIADEYFEKIPFIYEQLLLDAKSIEEFDPAVYSLEEIILAYPGFQAIMTYRLAHPLYALSVPILPRLMSEYAHTNTGIDIHPGAKIGKSFFIDHGTGVVIGETSDIGNNVKIYQGVTIGALNVKKNEAKTKRHPTIEDNVIIYSGSTILGGKTVIGHNSVIGGNVWLTKSVDPYSVVYNVSEIKVRNGNINEPINFVI
ncbi:MAG: serine O-acetyltransferase [Bacteroidales bacterium]|jgi:serine O-acetyltransferase|nr:serine O-acetyltransferase [Bacteroidales bacterium]